MKAHRYSNHDMTRSIPRRVCPYKPAFPFVCVINFFEVRDGLSEERAASIAQRESKESSLMLVCRNSLSWTNRWEQSINWLLTAALLVYLVLALVSL